ncbi:MAG TPA: protein translocase subunit SecF [Candidatus Tectomicrobia bacterium]|nr:protein translocase subunit SecF [Candidatus Tectomicrobia bacterium]
MEIIRPGINLDFVGRMKPFAYVSAALVILSFLVIVVRGFNYGIDFAGGSLLQLHFARQVSVEQVRATLRTIGLEESEIQRSDKDGDFLLRIRSSDEALEQVRSRVVGAFQQELGEQGIELRRAEQVGPKVGRDLSRKALLAVIWSSLGILVYIWWRFGFRLEFALAVVVADIHDVLLTLGLFALTGKEVTLTILAAVLTVAGYSVNDSIVVLDRIRENLRGRPRDPFDRVVNASLNETLSRTILTGGSVLFTLLALMVFGGDVLNDFALALLVGVIAGTYSSLFVVAPMVLYWPWSVSRRTRQRPQPSKAPPARAR